jgi:FkbM family methyltransferase
MYQCLTSLLGLNRSTPPKPPTVNSIYGDFVKEAKHRLDLTYDYEHAQICAFKRAASLLSPSRLMDVGANIGVYSVYLSDVPSLVSIHAFEPTPSTYSILTQNIGLTHTPDKIHASPIALSREDGSMDFAIYGDLAGSNAIADTTHSKATPTQIVTVTTRKLDSLIKGQGETFVCKIDVEGHELGVIEGAQGYLQNNRGLLQVETFPKNRRQLRLALSNLGYDILFRMKNDFFFTNVSKRERSDLREIMFDEVGNALAMLQKLKIHRRMPIRHTGRITYGSDPVLRQAAS